jgi:uncharacterized protein (DUF1684 family)
MNARNLTMNRMPLLLLSIVIAACGADPGPVAAPTPTPVAATGTAPAAAPAADHEATIRAWRETRVTNLRRPDGWLSLVGLHWLTDGEQSVGSAEGNAVRLASGPAKLGTITVAGGSARFVPDPAAGELRVQTYTGAAWTDAAADAGAYVLDPDSGAAPGRILVGSDIGVALIERGGRLALRVKDANAPTRSGFAGIEYFPIDAGWRIEAEWVPHATPQTFDIQNVLGMVDRMVNPGYARFTREGREYRLYPVLEDGADEWFFIFADRTSGRETYGPGRFLYAPAAVDGKVVLDFNKAYNPPCAFTDYSTCPLPPPENRLDLAVTAGEKKYGAH